MNRFGKFWTKLTKPNTPLISKDYVEMIIYLLYWLGFIVAVLGFILGIALGIAGKSFIIFLTVTIYGLGAWLAIIIAYTFMTLGLLKLSELEKSNRMKKAEKEKAEKEKESEKKDA